METFDREFEEVILAQCLQDSEYLKAATRLLDEHHFSARELSWVWKMIRGSWLSYAERLTPKILSAHAEKDFPDEEKRLPYIKLIVRLYRKKVEAPRATLEALQKFVRFVSVQMAVEGSVDKLEKGEVDEAWTILRKATLKDIRPSSYKMTRWLEEFEHRQAERKHCKEHPEEHIVIPTGLKKVDEVFDGGLRVGELGLIMATTSMGKSIMMNHLGFTGIIHDFGVLHFTLEMSDAAVAARYDSRFTGMLHKKFKTFDFSTTELRSISDKVKRNMGRLKDKLRIVSMPIRSATLAALHHAYEEAKAEMKINMILVDSGDHLQGAHRYESYRIEQAEVYWGLKSFAEEDGVVVWSTTHAKQEYSKKLAGAEAASESYDKARIADAVLTINKPGLGSRSSRVSEEEEDPSSEPKIIRPANAELYIAKYRDGEARIRVPLANEFERMLIKEAAE